MLNPMTITIGVLVLIAVIFVFKGVVVVQQSEAMVIERLGSYNRTLGHGINWIIPFLDQPRAVMMKRYVDGSGSAILIEERRIDQRETVMDFPSQSVVTKDNVTVKINGALYFRIVDAKTAVYQVENLAQAIEILVKTSLRSKIGKMELDQIFESRNEINSALEEVMDEAGNEWGVKITRVEIQDIELPHEVEDAMRKVMVAERNRRAAVTEAEGEKRAAILTAEGDRTARVERAEGEKQSAVLLAEGQQKAISTVLKAAESHGDLKTKDVVAYLVALEYMRTLPNIAKDGERVFMPYESSALLGSLGPIQELLKKADLGSANV